MNYRATRNNSRNSSYPWSKKQQRFINTKSRIILRIIRPELTRHESRNGRSHRRKKWRFIGIGSVFPVNSRTQLSPHFQIPSDATAYVDLFPPKCSKLFAKPLTYLEKLSLAHCFEVLPVCWEPIVVNCWLLIARRQLCRPTGCRSASDAHFRFFAIFLFIYLSERVTNYCIVLYWELHFR